MPASMYLMNSLSCLTTGQIYSAKSQKGDISERICDSNFNRPTLSGESSVGNKLTFFRPCSISKTKCRPGSSVSGVQQVDMDSNDDLEPHTHVTQAYLGAKMKITGLYWSKFKYPEREFGVLLQYCRKTEV